MICIPPVDNHYGHHVGVRDVPRPRSSSGTESSSSLRFTILKRSTRNDGPDPEVSRKPSLADVLISEPRRPADHFLAPFEVWVSHLGNVAGKNFLETYGEELMGSVGRGFG